MNLKSLPAWKLVVVALPCFALISGLLVWSHLERRQDVQIKVSQAIPTAPAAQNATPEMKEFLKNQTTLAQKMEQMRSQTPGGTLTLTPQAFIQFRQQNADLLTKQSQLAQILAQQQQSKNNVLAPTTITVPANASPKMRSYLQLRDQIMRDQIAFMNQHRNDDLNARLADMQQWRQQNANRLQHLQQLVQSLSQATPN